MSDRAPDSMVGRIAYQIAVYSGAHPGQWAAYVPHARAAISEMRGLTGTMNATFVEAYDILDDGDYLTPSRVRVAWQAAIDAAMKE